MRRRGEGLVMQIQFFEEFFAGPEAGELDFDILIGLETGEKDEALARSTIFTGSPISRTKHSPPFPMAKACSTSWDASGIVMK